MLWTQRNCPNVVFNTTILEVSGSKNSNYLSMKEKESDKSPYNTLNGGGGGGVITVITNFSQFNSTFAETRT